MRRSIGLFLACALLLLSSCNAYRSADEYDYGGQLVWRQEFDGTELDASAWNRETGATGWGNEEWENYTDSPENSFIADGCLVIQASYDGTNWPDCGEIDVMEFLGDREDTVHGTVHGPGYSGAAGKTASYTLPGGASFSDDFHVFSIQWEPNSISWRVDGVEYHRVGSKDLLFYQSWEFDKDFRILLNLAVGGQWPGYPSSDTTFPQRLLVDWIRYYR